MNTLQKGWVRRHGPALLGLAVSGLLTALAFKNVRFSEVAKAVSEIRIGWLPFMAAVILGDLIIRSLRWRLLLSSAAPAAALWPVVRLETIGLAINNVVFLRLGEVARAYLAGREFGIPMVTSLATIFIERVLDMITITCLFGIASRVYPALVSGTLSGTAFVLVAGLALGLWVLAMEEERLQRGMIKKWLDRYPIPGAFVEQAVMGARSLKSLAVALQAVALGACLWLMDALLYWSGGMAMGLKPHLGYWHSVLVLSSAAAASFLPAVPGSFGAYEQAIKSFLVYFGVDAATALGYAGVIHVINYVIVTGLGIIFLYRTGITLAHLKTIRKT